MPWRTIHLNATNHLQGKRQHLRLIYVKMLIWATFILRNQDHFFSIAQELHP